VSATLDGTGSCLIRVTPEEDEVNDTLKDVLAHIDAGAAAVRAEGDKLTARIKLFEEWLSRLAGRVEHVARFALRMMVMLTSTWR